MVPAPTVTSAASTTDRLKAYWLAISSNPSCKYELRFVQRATTLAAAKGDNRIVQVDDAPEAEHRGGVADAAIFTREQRKTLRDAIRRAWDAHEPHRL